MINVGQNGRSRERREEKRTLGAVAEPSILTRPVKSQLRFHLETPPFGSLGPWVFIIYQDVFF